MARLARVIIPGYPHHITRRGNRRQDVFFRQEDYVLYLDLMSRKCREEGVDIWGYCLMTNHVHLIVTPGEDSDISKAIGEAHKQYTRTINLRENWRGYLWQGRFASYPMDYRHLLAAMAYTELNPVRAGIVKEPWEYKWSSVHAHLSGKSDRYVNAGPLLEMVPDWKAYLCDAMKKTDQKFVIPKHNGRPLGDQDFLDTVERVTGRDLQKKKPGRKK